MSLIILLALGAFVLGGILGSFLNVLILRFNTGRGFFKAMGGRSHCMRCNHVLGVGDLVPVFSYLYLGGRCRYCGCAVSVQYPLVESLAAVLSLALFLLFYPYLLWWGFWLLFWLTVLFIVVYDMRHMIIPWSASLFLLFLAAVTLFLQPFAWSAVLAGPLLALPLFLTSLFSGGRWMGWADSVFELSLGAVLGLSLGITALMFAVWIGALVGLCLMTVSALSPKRARGASLGFTIQSEIPFAPFLALGTAIVFFFHVDLFSIFFFL